MKPTKHHGIFRRDRDGKRLCIGSAVSSKYKPHTINDVVALAQAGAQAFDGEIKIDCNWREGHYLTISPTDDYRRSIFGTDDNIFPRLIIGAGYDGKGFEGSIGVYRDACENLDIPRVTGEKFSVKLRHSSNLHEYMKETVQRFRAVASKFTKIGDMLQRMETRKVNLIAFLSEVFPELEETATEKKKSGYARRINSIVARIVKERLKTGRPEINPQTLEVSAYEAYNGVQGYFQWDVTRRNNPSSFDRAALSWHQSEVSGAFDLGICV